MRWLAVVVSMLVAAAAAAAPVLQRIDVLQNGTVVRLHLSTAVSSAAHTLSAEGSTPPRIYVDLPGTAFAPMTARLAAGGGELLRVRAGQLDPMTVRVVLDLAHAVPFDFQQDETTITVTLRPEAPADAARPTDTTPPSHAAAAADVAPRATDTTPAPRPPARAKRSKPDLRYGAPSTPLVVLDAGHGGHDPGAEGVGGVWEKDVVLDLAHEMASRLAIRLPVDVILTRNDDTFVPIGRRLALPSERATLFISLHANACSHPGAGGFEVYYGGGTLRDAASAGTDPRAALLGRCIGEALEDRLGGLRGVPRPGRFHVLVRNPVPAVLVEVGYLTHADDAARFKDAEYRRRLADALIDGVAAYLRASAPGL
ncbi:MAG TPA: N-acetylmuramoyl-L-alanine amidase [Candidatus Binatia bacterium]|nr:N-acetylmuramoyl-L-alanine amidase [Candidatus Binatia bacterium]